jgi:hypothetical protein
MPKSLLVLLIQKAASYQRPAASFTAAALARSGVELEAGGWKLEARIT